ncbi:MAG TPA: helix-turn-helix transcriptional regulator [Pseudoflavonifractor sp.]|nr:helix-turn-helix transcriptional regulator [Pseudoflavonifractor sp.]
MPLRVKEFRERKELTQTELAKRVGVTQSAVAKWETGGFTPSTSTLFLLADVLGCTIDQLCGRETPAPRPAEVAS